MSQTARSDFLFARPSVVEGLARILDLGGTLTEFNSTPTAEIADDFATSMDWAVVAGTLRSAMHGAANEVEATRDRQLTLAI